MGKFWEQGFHFVNGVFSVYEKKSSADFFINWRSFRHCFKNDSSINKKSVNSICQHFKWFQFMKGILIPLVYDSIALFLNRFVYSLGKFQLSHMSEAKAETNLFPSVAPLYNRTTKTLQTLFLKHYCLRILHNKMV